MGNILTNFEVNDVFANSLCGVMSHVILCTYRTNWKKLLSF